MIIKTDKGKLIKVGGRVDPERAIIDSGTPSPYRFSVPGFRFINSRQVFSKAFTWTYCSSYEVQS